MNYLNTFKPEEREREGEKLEGHSRPTAWYVSFEITQEVSNAQ
jgi:hypothetical protein